MASMARTVTRNVAFGMSAQLIIKIISFAFSIFIVRHLGAEEYGQYAAVLAFGAIFVFFADLGLSPYTVRAVARHRDSEDAEREIGSLYGNVLALRLILSAITGIFVVAFAYLTDQPLVMVGAIMLNAVGLMMYGVQGTSDAALTGYERIDRSSRIKVISQIVFVALGGLALILGLGYYGLIYATLASTALLTYLCLLAAHKLGVRPRWPNWRMWLPLLRASLPFGIIALATGISAKFDSVLLNLFHGDRAVGYYNAVYNLVFSAVLFSNVINTSLFPSLTRKAAQSLYGLTPIYERTMRYLLILSLPIAAGCWALADQIVPFLFGQDYRAATPALAVVIWVVPLMYLTEFLGYITVIRGEESQVARSLVISSSCNVALNMALVPSFGFIGAAVITVVTELILVGQYSYILRHLLRTLDLGQVLFRPVLATGIMTVITLMLSAAGLPLLVIIGLSSLAYVGLIVALGLVGPEELNFIRGMSRNDGSRPPLGEPPL
jgi:O-antigen/teichoic acid export membrane protein